MKLFSHGSPLLVVFGAVVLLLAGCGASAPTVTSAPAVASNSNLNGNWLLTGALPFSSPVGPVSNNSFGVAATFQVIGNQIVISTSTNVPCGFFTSDGAGTVLTGTIASDGSFSAATPATTPSSLATMQMTGAVPLSVGSSWKGTLNYANTSTSCAFAQAVSFTATPIANITGTYAGAATLSFESLGAASQPVTFSFSLQQGATLPGTTTPDIQLLSGTVIVQGGSCFTSGTAAAGVGSGVLGTVFIEQFAMNDGATLNLIGNVQDASALKLAVTSVLSSGGKCGLVSTGPFALAKQ
jgi:hypothetical protein